MKKSAFLIVISALFFFVILNNKAGDKVMMYSPDGRMITVELRLQNKYKHEGWYDYPVSKLYSPDGTSMVVSGYSIAYYENNGWYSYPVVRLYAVDGRSEVVAKGAKNLYVDDGWYTYPVVNLYNVDGEVSVFPEIEKDEHKEEGWYPYQVMNVYSADGRVLVIDINAQMDYRKVGWFSFVPDVPESVEIDDFVVYRMQNDVIPDVMMIPENVSVSDFSLSSSDETVLVVENGRYVPDRLYGMVSVAEPFKEGVVTLTVYTAGEAKGSCNVLVKNMEFYNLGTKNLFPDFGYFSGFKMIENYLEKHELSQGYFYKYKNWQTVEDYMRLLENYGWTNEGVQEKVEFDFYVFSASEETEFVAICDYWQYDTVYVVKYNK